MRVLFLPQGWEDYLYWQGQDKKTLKRLNRMIKECRRTPFEGIGKPEQLKYRLSGFWSRRITEEHRLVYLVEDDALIIAQCRVVGQFENMDFALRQSAMMGRATICLWC